MALPPQNIQSGILADEQPDAFYPWSFSGITFAGFRMRTDFDFHHSKIQGFQCPCVICNTDLDVFVSCRISCFPGTGKASDIVFVQSGCACSGDMESDLVWDGHYSVASIGVEHDRDNACSWNWTECISENSESICGQNIRRSKDGKDSNSAGGCRKDLSAWKIRRCNYHSGKHPESL